MKAKQVEQAIDKRELQSAQQDLNNVYTASEVSPTFQGHYTNTDTSEHGIANLIAEILTEREAVFPLGAEDSELRKVVISAGMFASEIIAEVQNRFTLGTTRYPYETVHAYLSVFQNARHARQLKGIRKVAQVRLTNAEDKPRPCYKPRRKYYLVQE